MKKFFSFVILVSFFCFIFFGCSTNSNSNKKFKILTSCYPVYIMALNIAKDIENVEVLNMCENNTGCLHNFQLRSEDLKKIESCNAFVINGAGMESFLDKIIKELPNVKIIDSSENINLLKNTCEHHHHHHSDEENDEHEHEEHCDCHNENNPHIWMSIDNYIVQVKNITNALSNLDNKNAENYNKNAESYINKLTILKDKISKNLANLKNKDIITFHEAFPYFANEFGLNIVGIINHEPGEEPSMKEIKEVINLVKEKNVKSIFTEPQYSKSAALTISSETGAKIYALDCAVTGENDPNSYINIMNKNLDVLMEALN